MVLMLFAWLISSKNEAIGLIHIILFFKNIIYFKNRSIELN